MEHNAKNICITVISDKEQNLDKLVAEFRISGLLQYFVHFDKIQYFFKALKTDFTIPYFFNTVWKPCLLYLSTSVSAFHFVKCFFFFVFAFLEKIFFSCASSSCVRCCTTRLSEHQEFSVRLSDARIWKSQSRDKHPGTASGVKVDISLFERW